MKKHEWLSVPGNQPIPGLMLAVSGRWVCAACGLSFRRGYLSALVEKYMKGECPGKVEP